ncbi:YcxB family protein [Streptomyces kebangsaanensis]|uniref:YcxB family protein n=1 Tax=Streptomyces kebangsaanensis TaxID=864058 RepID=UPI001160E51B|nr:YcxB family protein [Streptomyces kebangsaanensis]
MTEAELIEALCARSGRADPGASRRIPVLFGLTLLLTAVAVVPGPLRALAFLASVPFGMLLGSLYETLRLHRRVFALHQWAQAQKQYAIRVDDTGVHARTAVSSGTLHWAAFTRCQETENLFVLSVDDSMGGMCVLPKRGVRDAGGVERLREPADRHVTPYGPS